MKSVHIFPVDTDTDINAYQAPYKTYKITGHHAEKCAQPPPEPAKNGNTKYEY